MFKKKCSKCNEKVSKNYEFCPFCGANFEHLDSSENNEDYGFLGKDDFIEEDPFMSFNDSFMDKMLSNAVKMLEKQLKNLPRELREAEINNEKQNKIANNNLNVQFFVNGKRVFPQNSQETQEIEKPIKIKNNIPNEKIEKFSKLPKKEPASKIRRLSKKIIYELEVPGVKTVEDIIINQLENSIEIKALGKDKVYSKTLNINLPIINYKLSKGNLILELKTQN